MGMSEDASELVRIRTLTTEQAVREEWRCLSPRRCFSVPSSVLFSQETRCFVQRALGFLGDDCQFVARALGLDKLDALADSLQRCDSRFDNGVSRLFSFYFLGMRTVDHAGSHFLAAMGRQTVHE